MAKYFTIYFLFIATISFGNNLQLSPVTLSTSGGSSYLNFTISWENSWRVSSNSNNWDAVWIFFKRRDCAAIQWHHVNLSDQDADHTATAPLFVNGYSDKKGVMIYRLTNGFGNISNANIQIKLDAPPAGNYEYKVCGIEMVNVKQDAFYVGDGTSNFTFKIGTTSNPYLISSEASINFSQTGTNLWSNYPSQNSFTLPTAYPKGYNAFYCMKYEISQGQYADFLNTIAQDAFLNRYDANNVNVSRYTIAGSWPAITALAPDRACNWISIEDLSAYLDWSALSPLSELEFEKVCRGGNIIPITNEFAWGGNQITDANTITSGTDGQPNETVDDIIATGTGLANHNNSVVLGPLRCGFAFRTGTTRFAAGASFYGATEMSGNVYEFCINVDSSTYGRGKYFIGNHGDGELSTASTPGYSNQGWPGQIAGDLSEQYFSFSARGGAWTSLFNAYELRVSDRSFKIIEVGLPTPDAKGRSFAFGGRGVSRRQ
jgi:formylglycine-generating enzyme required for sulfatase activity